MTSSRSIISFVAIAYILLSCFITFILGIDADKQIGILITGIFGAFVLFELASRRFKKKLSPTDVPIIVGVVSILAAYAIQFVVYGIIQNTEALTLLCILGTIYLLDKIKKHIDKKTILLTLSFATLLFSAVTINNSVGYTFTTGAGGILSAFVLLISFLAADQAKSRISNAAAIASGILIVAISIRGTILSLLIYMTLKSGARKAAIALAAVGLIIGVLFLAMPESRIFGMHTSGRLVHWEIILSNFDSSKILYGMGAHSSTNILLDMGLEESMAAPHNEYIRYIFDLGIFGAIALACILLSLYRACAPDKKFLVLILALQMFTDNVFTYYFNYLIFFILICMCSSMDTSKKINHDSFNWR
ncbi:hypothetical protein E8E95_17260 [Pseudomonas sp. BN414]|uniref:hypothetical protein n=1 Tax=Pseudomonas sp. BN414 TaxID=2567888 RepID=UPI002458D0B6|nr:hypothetical protein [Pseudomonas sp. BN414]MDH4568433.1 hypothetical protein [Pseudomonas sp. BN414]